MDLLLVLFRSSDDWSLICIYLAFLIGLLGIKKPSKVQDAGLFELSLSCGTG